MAIVPVAVGFTLSPGQFARYEALLGKIDHRGDKAELLLAMAEALLVADLVSEEPPEVARRRAIAAPQYQVHVHQCPECARKTVSTPAGDVELGAVEGEVACCDAEVHNPGERNTTTIPPKMRREVQARDRYRCRRKGRGHRWYLHVHHVVPRVDGGSNEAENLVTLCSACHDLWHRRGGEFGGCCPKWWFRVDIRCLTAVDNWIVEWRDVVGAVLGEIFKVTGILSKNVLCRTLG